MSGFDPAAATGEAQTPGFDSLGGAPAVTQKRPASTAPRKAPTPAPQPVAPPSEGYQRNRRAAAAGVHAVAAEVAAMEEDDLAPDELAAQFQQQQHIQQQHAQAHAHHRGSGGDAMHGMAAQMQQVDGAPPTHGRTSAEVARMFQEREPLIPGLNHAADRPQVGRGIEGWESGRHSK